MSKVLYPSAGEWWGNTYNHDLFSFMSLRTQFGHVKGLWLNGRWETVDMQILHIHLPPQTPGSQATPYPWQFLCSRMRTSTSSNSQLKRNCLGPRTGFLLLLCSHQDHQDTVVCKLVQWTSHAQRHSRPHAQPTPTTWERMSPSHWLASPNESYVLISTNPGCR